MNGEHPIGAPSPVASQKSSPAAPAQSTQQSQTLPIGTAEAGTTQPTPTTPLSQTQSDANTAADTKDTAKKKNSRTTSGIWIADFTRIDDQKATCNHCKGTFAADTVKNGTSSLRGHLDRCKSNPNKKKGQASLLFPPPKPGDNVKLVASSFDSNMCRRRLVEFIIKDELPFRLVESEGFRAFCQQLEPRFKVPSRMTIYRDLLVIYKEEKENLKKYFETSKQRVSLTTDTWTSPNKFNYMCVTVHYIDHNWKLSKRIIMFCQIKGHTGIALGKMLEKCLMDWGLEDVFSVTLDNASSNNLAMEYLKTSVVGWTRAYLRAEYLHVRCAAHVLALVVRDAVLIYNKSISRIRSVVKYVNSSPARIAKFKHYATIEKVDCKRALILDVKTRWNSTYLMLDSAEKFESVFNRLGKHDRGFQAKYIFPEDKSDALPSTTSAYGVGFDIEVEDFSSSSSSSDDDVEIDNLSLRGKKKKNKKKKKPKQHAPYPEDWFYARGLVKCLKVFFDSTVKFSASTHVTTHSFLWHLAVIHEQLVAFRENRTGDPFIASMAEMMWFKYNKYWGSFDDMNSVLFFARILDPREKENGLEFVLECLYENDDDRVKSVMRKVKQELVRLFEEYKSMYSSVEDGPSSVANVVDTPASTSEVSIEDVLASRAKKKKTNPSIEGKSELEKYLLEDCHSSEESDFDILAWWQANSTKYKILSCMARDILAIPVSSVASESAFSTGKRVLSPWRSSLSARTVEALLCTQSWLQQPIALDFLSDYVPDDNSSIEEELLGPISIAESMKIIDE